MKSIVEYILESSKESDLADICSSNFADFYDGAYLKKHFPKCKETKNPKFVGIVVPEDFDGCKWLEDEGYKVVANKETFINDDGDEDDDYSCYYVYAK